MSSLCDVDLHDKENCTPNSPSKVLGSGLGHGLGLGNYNSENKMHASEDINALKRRERGKRRKSLSMFASANRSFETPTGIEQAEADVEPQA